MTIDDVQRILHGTYICGEDQKDRERGKEEGHQRGGVGVGADGVVGEIVAR